MGSNGASQTQEVSETDIVQAFYNEHSLISTTSGVNEISSFKYVIVTEIKGDYNLWADGEVFQYQKWPNNWANTGQKVKFFILAKEYSLEAKKVLFENLDELMKLPGSSHVITPIFATYNVLLKRVVLCYPDFDQPVKDWLPKHKVAAAEHTLPTIWNSLIRTVLDNITDTKVLKLGRFEDISSYIWDSRSKELKLILFPLEENERDDSYSTRFASFLRLNLYDHWPHPDLDSFIQALESAQDDPLKLQLITHPLIEDMDALSVLIRTTWRLLKDLTSLQQSTMDATIDHTKWGNNKSWQGFQYFDDVLNSMLGGSRRSNDAAGLFCFVKEVCAHYTENHRKRYLNRRGYHPVWIIKKCFPGLILAIYKLNLDPNWLKS